MKKQEIKKFGICALSVIPLWMRPEAKSNMISQILFGEYVEVLSIRNKHCIRVRCLFDQLTGYVDPKQIWFFKNEENVPDNKGQAISMELSHPVFSKELSVNILIGSTLPRFDGLSFYIRKQKFSYSGQAMLDKKELIPADLFIKLLRRFIMSPELEGGRTVFGIDSGAFAQLVFKICHLKLPRYPNYQIDFGQPVFFTKEARLGDLVFCENKDGLIDHVAIVSGKKKVIHVHGQVRIDKLDHHGIFNLDERRYTHRVRIIKRIDGWLSTEETVQ